MMVKSFSRHQVSEHMIAGVSSSQLVELVVLLLVTGAAAGFLAGIFGIGGGAVLVPVLYECFRIAGVPLDARMPLCVGTSLAIIIPTSIRSWRAHQARGSVDMNILKRWAIPVLVGVIAGSVIAQVRARAAVQICFRRGGVVGGRAVAVWPRTLAAR